MSGDRDPKDSEVNPPLRFLDKLLHSSRSNYFLAGIILLIAMIPRVFYISIGVMPNGIDEGVDIMAGRMWSFGYDMYSQINTVQAPVMLTIYGLIEADPVLYRLFSTLCSLIIIAMAMKVAYRIGGRHVMVATGSFMAMDLMFLHESRLASLDMFCLLWVAVGTFYLVKFRQSGRKRSLFFLGGALAVASMIKLFGIIAAGAVGLILLSDMLSNWKILRPLNLDRFLPDRKTKVEMEHILIYSLTFILVVLLIMMRHGVIQVIEGILLNQLHRPVTPLGMKITTFGVFFLLNIIAIPFIIFGVKKLYKRPEGVILIISGFFLFWFMFQATTWFHHLIFLSPAISLTAGIGIIEVGKRISKAKMLKSKPRVSKKVLIYMEVFLVLSAALVGGGFSYVVKERGVPIQEKASDILRDITDEGDFVISGDPSVALLAGRLQPPDFINLAQVQYPEVTSENLTLACIDYAVEAVVLAYHILDMPEFVDFVESNFTLRATIIDDDFFLDNDVNEYRIYSLPIDSKLRTYDEWGSKRIEGREGR